MKVFVVFSSNSNVEGVFSSRENAEKAIKLYNEEVGFKFYILDRTVDEAFRGEPLK